MKISIIGAGKVGRALGRAALLAGYEIGDVVSESRQGARAAVRFIGAGTPRSAPDPGLESAGLLLISTQDDRIPEAVELIRRSAKSIARPSGSTRQSRPVVLHTSGALSSRILRPLKPAGFAIASCHPLQTFESARRAVELIKSSYFCVEGDPRAVRLAKRLVRDIGGGYFEIPTGHKALYHAGAVLASGGLTALISVSLEILARCGLGETEARRVLFPLIEGTIAGIKAVGPVQALTGPVKRRDAGTIERNIRALAGADRDWASLYKLLSGRASLLTTREQR